MSDQQPQSTPAPNEVRQAGATRRARSRFTRWWGPLTVALVVAGLGTAGAAAALSASADDEADTAPQPSSSASVAGPASPAPSTSPTPTPAPTGSGSAVSELADAAWVERVAAAASIPERALAAYAGAALQVDAELPGCHLGWNTLAAIGLVESDHGTTGGATLGADGTTVPAILGPVLDGTGGHATITDTDSGALDGDQVYDRAVGPMQFLPGSWARWAADGNGDGVSDPQNIDDAALAAGRYLCDSGDLADPDTWVAAIAAYNDTVEYNNTIADAADTYAALN